MKFIAKLSTEEQVTLEEAHKKHPSFRFRQRAKAILLSSQHYTIKQLVTLFDVRRDTISLWLDRWNESGIAGLNDAERNGRPSNYTPEEQALFLHYLEKTPHQRKVAIAKIQAETGKEAAADTYKRILKKATIHGSVVDTPYEKSEMK